MHTRSLLLAAAAISLLSSTGLVSSSYAQSGGDAGASAGTGGQMQSGASGGQKGDVGAGAGAGADVKGGASSGTCPDGTPLPADGACPTAKGAQHQGAKAAAPMQRQGAPDKNAASGSDNGSGTTSDQMKAGGKAGASDTSKAGASDQSTSKSGANSKSDSNSKSSSSNNTTVNQTTNVNVTTEQRTEIQKDVKTVNVSPITVDFSVDVGVVVPHKVHLVPLPATIIKIVPEYRGYLFFVLADGRIVIVDPDSLKIVLII